MKGYIFFNYSVHDPWTVRFEAYFQSASGTATDRITFAFYSLSVGICVNKRLTGKKINKFGL